MLIITCEHASNKIPVEYQAVFANHKALLETHRGYDIGALELAQLLATHADKAFYAEYSRLLIELNRSLHHAKLFSDVTKSLVNQDQQFIVSNYYLPYREAIATTIADILKDNNCVTHISVHSFTPELNGVQRNCDIGLLYDSQRKAEQAFCRKWKTQLLALQPNLKIRFNYPYLGKADGFTSYLRKQFKPESYIGIELEVNQRFALANDESWHRLKIILEQALISLRL